MEQRASPATRQHEVSVIRRALRLAHHLDKVALPSFPTIRVDNARTEYISEDEFATSVGRCTA